MKNNLFTGGVGIMVLGLGVFTGCLVGAAIQDEQAYRQGQLDYQAGKIEWTMIDGKLHHIQEGE